MSYWFAKKDDGPAFNCSFMTKANMEWFYNMLKYRPSRKKDIVFLPCACGEKTRAKNDGKKRISNCTSHQFLSAITRNEKYEQIILSEPLTLIPYHLQHLQPDYNLPVSELSIQSERIFINNLALWLARIKLEQPERRYVYYVGATHHFLILKYANINAGNPFKIIYIIPHFGLRDYAKSADKLIDYIRQINEEGIEPLLKPVNVEKWLKGHGRYTNRKFWHEILCWQKKNEMQVDFEESHVIVGTEKDYQEGFLPLFSLEAPPFPPRETQTSLF